MENGNVDKKRAMSILALTQSAISATLCAAFCVLGCYSYELHAFSFAFGLLAVLMLVCALVLSIFNLACGASSKDKILNIVALIIDILCVLALLFCFLVFTVVTAII